MRKATTIICSITVLLGVGWMIWKSSPDTAIPAEPKPKPNGAIAKIPQPQAATENPPESEPPPAGALDDEMERYLERKGRTAETLTFVASMTHPINLDYLNKARALDPDSPFVHALDIRIASEKTIRPGPGHDKMALAKTVDSLLIKYPENRYYQRLKIHAAVLARDQTGIAAFLKAQPVPEDLVSGYLGKAFRTQFEDFALHEKQWSEREVLKMEPSDRFTSTGAEGTASMIAFSTEKDLLMKVPISDGTAALMMRTIALTQGDRIETDNIESLSAQLHAELRLVTLAIQIDRQAVGSMANMNPEEYVAELNTEREEATMLRRLREDIVTNGSDSEISAFMADRRMLGELGALRKFAETIPPQQPVPE